MQLAALLDFNEPKIAEIINPSPVKAPEEPKSPLKVMSPSKIEEGSEEEQEDSADEGAVYDAYHGLEE